MGVQGCRWLAAAATVAAAFEQACREAGIPPHLPPGGACPQQPCPCQGEAVAAWVENRALELALAALGPAGCPAALPQGDPRGLAPPG